MNEERRCLVVDDQPVVRLGVREVLEERYEIEEVEDGEGAVQLLTDVGAFDVAVVEMQRPSGPGSNSMTGPAIIRALLKAQPGLGIVAHGDWPERHIATEAIKAGATAFVAKSSDPSQLSAAVETAATDSGTFVDPAASPRRGGRGGLTRRQRQILQHYANGESTVQTARKLGLSEETIRTHTKAILTRLDAGNRAHAVAIALRNCLID